MPTTYPQKLTPHSPFLAFVSSTQQFDTQLSQYVNSSYVQEKYQQLLGCGNVNLTNTTNLYARYTTSVICNAIVQNSIKPCALSSADSPPLCAESCAQQATIQAYQKLAYSCYAAYAFAGVEEEVKPLFSTNQHHNGRVGLSGGRVARMSALEGNTSDSPSYEIPAIGGVAEGSHRRYGDTSESEAYGEAPESRRGYGPPTTGKRNGSLSSQSVLGAMDDPSSPNTEGQISSPEGIASGQSEQLPFFKDYYSEDEIHPNDKVSTLWAYSPRAGDEFELERGDMLKVVGIWDDGWATGVRIKDRAEDYDGKHKVQRDSGVSNGSGRGDSPPPSGELKAFPLVCVCLPEYWKQTIEGDDSSENGVSGPPHGFGRLQSPSLADTVCYLLLLRLKGGFLGAMSKESVFELLDYFHSQGGNFIDTANNYQSEQSEMWIGEWLHKHPGIRDEMVIATKYTTCFSSYKSHDNIIHSNSAGNGSKSLHVSIRNSLHKLKTDYIDILYVHWWDFTTSIPELMQSLNTVVQQGKVIYLGVSDTPAWIVSKANQYARDHGLRQFVVYQGQWSAAGRDFERDIIPMCADEGMGLAPWGSLGGGNFKTKKQREEMKGEGRNMGAPSENHIKLTDALEKIADRKSTAITSVALAYVMHKAPYVFPIVGGRKIEHLKGNIEALSLELSDDDMAEIDGAAPFDIGFPLNFLSQKPGGAKGPGDLWLMDMAGHFDYVEASKPIKPSKV
ncbi:MAG: hypothetical protein ASARMPRED_001803 [Alectoria sarmentosa]|nr:MAG: hypothetical protein ASARMPRED_001803 [Alectoria sarmentosa]